MSTAIEPTANPLADTLTNRRNAGKRGPAVGRFLTDPGFLGGPKDHSAVRRIAAAHDVRVDALDQADEKVLELRTLLESPVPERPSLEAQDLKKAVASAARQRTIDAETRVIASELLVEAEAIANAAVRADLLPAAIETLCGRFDDALGDVVEAVDNVPDVPTSELGRLSVRQFELHGQLQRGVGMLEMLVEHRKELASFIGEPVTVRHEALRKWGSVPVLAVQLAAPPKVPAELVREYEVVFHELLGLRDLDAVAKWRRLVGMQGRGVLTCSLVPYGQCAGRVTAAARWHEARFSLQSSPDLYM